MRKNFNKLHLPTIDDEDFCSSIRQTIAEGRHMEYLQGVIDDYEWYKREFQQVFTGEQAPHGVYSFRVNYLLKKSVWREFELIGENTFSDFADAIIDSMGWNNDHMHGFTLTGRARKSSVGDGHREEAAMFAPGWEDDPFPFYKTGKVYICHIDYQKVPKIDFIFDFGDGHRFTIVFKGQKELARSVSPKNFPRLIDQRGVAPEQYPKIEE